MKPNMKALATDAEAITQRLGQNGEFQLVQRLPERIEQVPGQPQAQKPVVA